MMIRSYQDSYLPNISQLYYDTVHQVNCKDYTESQINTWAPEVYPPEFWLERLRRCQMVVAEQEHQIIGFAEFEDTGHIDCFYVHYQWQRRGVGKALLAHIENYARDLAISKLFLDASLTAVTFFQAQGFQIVRSQDQYYRGMTFKQFFMEKEVLLD